MKALSPFFILISLSFFLTSCSTEKEPAPIDCSTSDIDIAVTNITDASDCSAEDGTITVAGSGGVSPYQFNINDGDFQAGPVFSSLGAGTYTIGIKDDAGCIAEVDATIDGSAAFNISSIDSEAAGCKDSNGTITVQSTGGNNLQYSLNNGAFQASNVFDGLTAGTYSIKVKDNANCEVTGSEKVLSGTSFEDHVKPIIMANCAISGCHDGSSPRPNWTIFENVKNNAANIKSKTQADIMPPTDNKLSQQEKDLIACWVDDGALNN